MSKSRQQDEIGFVWMAWIALVVISGVTMAIAILPAWLINPAAAFYTTGLIGVVTFMACAIVLTIRAFGLYVLHLGGRGLYHIFYFVVALKPRTKLALGAATLCGLVWTGTFKYGDKWLPALSKAFGGTETTEVLMVEWYTVRETNMWHGDQVIRALPPDIHVDVIEHSESSSMGPMVLVECIGSSGWVKATDLKKREFRYGDSEEKTVTSVPASHSTGKPHPLEPSTTSWDDVKQAVKDVLDRLEPMASQFSDNSL